MLPNEFNEKNASNVDLYTLISLAYLSTATDFNNMLSNLCHKSPTHISLPAYITTNVGG